MKRFLCSTCHRIVRVRRLPADFAPNTAAHDANAHHIGTCAHHDAKGAPRARVNDRGRVRGERIIKLKMSTPSKEKKGKLGPTALRREERRAGLQKPVETA